MHLDVPVHVHAEHPALLACGGELFLRQQRALDAAGEAVAAHVDGSELGARDVAQTAVSAYLRAMRNSEVPA